MNLGSYLKAHRDARRLSQADLATACGEREGITQAALSRWERGVYTPSVRQLGIIGQAMQMTGEEVLEAVRLAGMPRDGGELSQAV